MKLRIKKSTTFFGLSLSALVVFAVSATFLFSGRPAEAQISGGRLITVHDRGVENTFITTKSSLKEALSEQGIVINQKDAVEPSIDEKLVAPDYQVNIYRARPVTIIDGAARQKVVTPYQSAERIVKDAGMTLYPEDETTLTRSTDYVSDGAGLQLTINRATLINIDLYGKLTPLRTQGKTVADMLKEKKIALGGDDHVSVALTTPLSEGMSLRIWREGKQTVTVDEAVPFETEQIKDADRAIGYKEVRAAGTDGKRTVTYEITIQNGVEVARTEIASVTVEAAVKQVIVIGAKLPTPTNPTENQQIGHSMMRAAGYGEEQWSCLYNLWLNESGWRVTAGNPSSGAYGIPQSLPASKMSSYGADYMTNASTQIAWGLDYIKGRYGTPCGAWNAFSNRNPHWY